jgi:CheY-specific phosphatase CheX
MTPAMLSQILRDVTTEVLTDTGSPCQVDANPSRAWEDDVLEARISIAGPVHGWFSLAATHGAGATLAGNMLGLLPSSQEASDSSLEAVAEIANMVAGRAAEKWFGPDGSWRMDPPIAAVWSPGTFTARAPDVSARVCFSTPEGEPIVATAFLQGGHTTFTGPAA